MTLHISVAGDPTLDSFTLFLPPRRDPETEDWRWYERFVHTTKPGGVHLTWAVLDGLIKRDGSVALLGPVAPHRQGDEGAQVLHSMVELRCLDPKKTPPEFVTDPGRAQQTRARVISFRGYDLQPAAPGAESASRTGGAQSADLVVLNDAGGALGQDAAFFAALARQTTPATLILHKRHGRFRTDRGGTSHLAQADGAGGRVWPREQLVLHLSADDLRRDGTRLRGRIGWRECVEDLRRAAQKGATLAQALDIYGAVIVQIGVEGAAMLTRPPGGGDVRCTLAYAPAEAEGFIDETLVGLSYGVMNAFLCALTMRAAAQLKARPGALPKQRGSDIKAALATSRDYARTDFSVTLSGESGQIEPPPLPKILTGAEGIELKTTRFAPPPAGQVAFGLPKAARARRNLAEQIVLNGMKEVEKFPHISINKLWAIESDEIVAYREIRRVILNYLATPARGTPLSLAVFGAPGSGKSFGIKQMTDDHDVETIEFNLSESGAEDLPGYFQELRDIRPDGKTPLCFFDEFDRNQYELVARFLAPMQDGKFRHAGRTHPIGRAILVFAGGTAHRFKDFQTGTALPGPDDAREARVKSLKLPDFASRLDGVLDIKGLNPEAGDLSEVVLRRAILLRSTFDRFAKRKVLDGSGRAMIDKSLLDAFLWDASYTSGSRSLEKIVTMSALRGNGHNFSASDLPSKAFLEPHLRDVDAFLAAAQGGARDR